MHGPLLREVRMLYGDRYPQFNRFIKKCEYEAYANARVIIAVDCGQKEIMVNDYCVSSEKKMLFSMQ